MNQNIWRFAHPLLSGFFGFAATAIGSHFFKKEN
jgi:hypothetical protein